MFSVTKKVGSFVLIVVVVFDFGMFSVTEKCGLGVFIVVVVLDFRIFSMTKKCGSDSDVFIVVVLDLPKNSVKIYFARFGLDNALGIVDLFCCCCSCS